jgi:hypothetical protein
MKEYAYEVRLRVVVRVRASNEDHARQVVKSILSPPNGVEIGLANQNNAAIGRIATVTAVDFVQKGAARRATGDLSESPAVAVTLDAPKPACPPA